MPICYVFLTRISLVIFVSQKYFIHCRAATLISGDYLYFLEHCSDFKLQASLCDTTFVRLNINNILPPRFADAIPKVVERRGRKKASYEPHIAEGLTQMFMAGTSTHKVGEVAQTLLGAAPSASTISRLNQSLSHQFDTWRQHPLPKHWRVLYLDGVHFSIRHG